MLTYTTHKNQWRHSFLARLLAIFCTSVYIYTDTQNQLYHYMHVNSASNKKHFMQNMELEPTPG